MEELFKGQISEVENAADTAYLLENNELFYDIGFKVMQNLEDSCLLKCHRLKYNGKIKLVYLTSEYLSSARVIADTEPELLGNILGKLFEAFTQIENLGFLDITCIENRLDKIFVDPVSNRIRVIYLPINGIGEKKNKNVFENEVKSQLVKLIQEVHMVEHPKVRMILEYLTDGTLRLQDITRRILTQNVVGQQQVRSQQRPLENGILLQAMNGAVAFSIQGRDFVIGKSKEKVDGEIVGNTAVSRVHCKILYRDGKYFIVDMGSSNGTFLNGERVTTTNPLLVQMGSRIRIANMEFVVRGK